MLNKLCESCGRNHDRLGVYCENCIDENENLKSFEEVRENLAKHISETQGYAEVAALKIADSILEQHPAWKQRYDKIRSDKEREIKNKSRKITYPLVGISVILVVVLAFILLQPPQIIESKKLYEAELIMENITDPDLFFEDKNLHYGINWNSTEIPFYRFNGETGDVSEVARVSTEDSPGLWYEADINEDFFVFFKYSSQKGTSELYVKNLKSGYEYNKSYGAGIIMDMTLIDKYIFYNDGGDRITRFLDVSNKENEPVEIRIDDKTNYLIDAHQVGNQSFLILGSKTSKNPVKHIYDLEKRELIKTISHENLQRDICLSGDKMYFSVAYWDNEKPKLIKNRKEHFFEYNFNTNKTKPINDKAVFGRKDFSGIKCFDGKLFFLAKSEEDNSWSFAMDDEIEYYSQYVDVYNLISLDTKTEELHRLFDNEQEMQIVGFTDTNEKRMYYQVNSSLFEYEFSTGETKPVCSVDRNRTVYYFLKGDYVFYLRTSRNKKSADIFRIKIN